MLNVFKFILFFIHLFIRICHDFHNKVSALRSKATTLGSAVFTRSDIADVARLLKLKESNNIDSLIDVMRTECYLLLKGPKLYQLSL